MPQSLPANLLQRLNAQAEQRGVSPDTLLQKWLEEAEAPAIKFIPYREILEKITEAFVAVDRDFNFTYVNANAARLLQSAPETMIGRNAWELFSAAKGTMFETSARLAMETNQLTRVVDFLPVANVWLEATIQPSEGGLAVFFHDVTERVRREAALRESEAHYRGIVESQIDFVCRYTTETVLTFVNDAYAKFHGKTREDLIGTSFLPLGPQEQHAEIMKRIEETKRDPSPHISLFRSIDSDGRAHWVEWTNMGIRDETGEVTMIQSVGRDVTRLFELEAERMAAHERELELEKEREIVALKERFLSMVTHEFRTPLSVITSSVDILRHYKDRLNDEQTEDRLDGIRRQVSNMLHLLDEVMLISRGNAKRIELNTELMNIREFFDLLVNNLRLVDQGRHELVLQIDPRVGLIKADRRLIEHIFINLLSNALKYSPSSTRVTVQVEEVDHMVRFTVRDQGIGIPLDAQSKLFEPFYRAWNVGDVEGTGLGMSIVKHSVDAHGGTITFESQPAHGTTFVVMLPVLPEVASAASG